MATRPTLSYAQLPVTLYPSRLRYILLSFVCLVFVSIGILIIRSDATKAFLGWFSVIFFGAGVIVLLTNLHPRAAYLTLEAEGYTLCSLFRKSFTPWSAVQRFGVISMRGTRMTAFDFVPGYTRARGMRTLNQALVGFDAALPTTYGMKAAHLAEQMNALLMEYRLLHSQLPSFDRLQFDKAE